MGIFDQALLSGNKRDKHANTEGADNVAPGKDGAGVATQIPRNSLALLMVAQLVVVLPHALQLSPWIVGVGLFCGWWRTQVHRGRWNYPNGWVRAFLVVISVLGVLVGGERVVSLEAATSLLILAFALKLLEMKSRRDAYLVIFLCYFVIATQFLFSQTLAVALYEIVATIVVTAALVGLHQWHYGVRPLPSLRLAASLVAQALPLTIVLFLLFPRVSPMWSVPMPGAAKTGISDRLTPGAVAQLSRSDELAFRAVFSGPVPPRSELYWRGLVYSRFDRGTWSVLKQESDEPADLVADETASGALDYEVILQPTGFNWLFALDVAVPRGGSAQRTSDYRLQQSLPVHAVTRYRVRSYPNLTMDAGWLDDEMRARELRLPNGNPRVRAFAAQLKARSQDSVEFAENVMAHIRNNAYHYTLQPPTLPTRDSVDAFWFSTQRGFCTHYAGALVYMARSVGIPARMVGGYQGGEINPITGHLAVRQYDAHAWVELWHEDLGWHRVDPTAAVAPSRIEQGLNSALSLADRASLPALSAMRLADWDLATDMLDWLDSLEHRWNLFVVGFDASRQRGLLQRWLGDLSPARMGLALLVAGGASLLLVALIVFWRRRGPRQHANARLFSRLCRIGAAAGVPITAGEAPHSYLQRLARTRDVDATLLQALQRDFDSLFYADSDEGAAVRKRLRGLLRRLQLGLTFGGAAADA